MYRERRTIFTPIVTKDFNDFPNVDVAVKFLNLTDERRIDFDVKNLHLEKFFASLAVVLTCVPTDVYEFK